MTHLPFGRALHTDRFSFLSLLCYTCIIIDPCRVPPLSSLLQASSTGSITWFSKKRLVFQRRFHDDTVFITTCFSINFDWLNVQSSIPKSVTLVQLTRTNFYVTSNQTLRQCNWREREMVMTHRRCFHLRFVLHFVPGFVIFSTRTYLLTNARRLRSKGMQITSGIFTGLRSRCSVGFFYILNRLNW